MSSTLRMTLAFVGGIITGGAAVYFYLNDKYAEISREEISAYRSEVRGRLKAAQELEEAFEVGKEAYEAKKEELDFVDYTSYFEKDTLNEVSEESNDEAFDIHMADRESPEEDLSDENEDEEETAYLDSLSEHVRLNQEMEEARRSGLLPYNIEHSEYLNGKQWYEKLDYVYYAGDDILADDKDDPIENPEELIGKNFRELFGQDADDPDILYIRNDQRGNDFEISRVNSCYSDEYPWANKKESTVDVIIGGEE